jgi:opacity protein-like surface antigen
VPVRAHARAIRQRFLTLRSHGLIELGDTSRTMKKLNAIAAFALALGTTAAGAQGAPATAFIAEGGVTKHGTYSVTAGVAWPSWWRREALGGEWTAFTELFASHWSAKLEARREALTQLGVVPVLRYRFDAGRSAWFTEGGIGLTYLDRLYQTDHKRFSTRFNFQDTIGVGRSFGARREHEVSLRFTHVSNAGIKEPNPGENFLQLRYARQF